MSKEKSSISCTHGKGLNCRICYDQTYGLDWKSPKMKTFKNKHFTKRDHECTNVVACVAEVAPSDDWVETYQAFYVGLESLYIQAGVKYYGYL